MLTAGGSDHSPILFLGKPKSPSLPRPFRFHSMLLRDKSCEEIILNRWAKPYRVNGNNIDRTLYLLGKDLTRWNKLSLRKVDEVIAETRLQIERLRNKDSNLVSVETEIKLNKKLNEYLCREEELWKQKSKELWLKEGDKNTKFFHSSTINRRKNNCIDKLKSNSGYWMDSREEIGDFV